MPLQQPTRAILVCVDYSDLLAITLKYNRHHFSQVCVVTSPEYVENVFPICVKNDAIMYPTDSFYKDGAVFNKWRALEEGLDYYGRSGWLCVMDADVLWPKELPDFEMEEGKLYTPLRRMCTDLTKPIPYNESTWTGYPIHRNVNEWAGYSQVFHASDPCLGIPPWHETDWKHAGGADSFFQKKWHKRDKVRPPFECLHLGPAGKNWGGRVSNYLDGTAPEKAAERQTYMNTLFSDRRKHRNFDHEKLQ